LDEVAYLPSLEHDVALRRLPFEDDLFLISLAHRDNEQS
jgi:hypothetical protein